MSSTHDTPAWIQASPECAFSIRDTSEPAVFRDRMWLSNGYYHGGLLTRDLWQSRDGTEWTLVSDQTPYEGYSEMIVYRDKLWAIKGSVWNTDSGLEWKQVSAQTPFGSRGYGELVVFQDQMWQLGSGTDVWRTEDGISWECTTTSAPYGDRYGSAVAVFHDRLWLVCGATKEENDPPEKTYPQYTTHRDVWCSDNGSDWTRVVEHGPFAPRMWVVAEVYAGRLWMLGGFSNRDHVNFAEAWSSEDGLTWTEYRPQPGFSPRHQVTPYVFGGSLWVVAGNSWPLTNDAWRLTLPGA
jgi:hypothetical protein